MGLTTYEGIASEAGRTSAEGTVIDNSTVGAHPASTRTWVSTKLIETRLGRRAFGIRGTFGPTGGWGTNVAWQTGAHSLLVDFAALRVWTTGRRLARIGGDNIFCRRMSNISKKGRNSSPHRRTRNGRATYKGAASCTIGAPAHGYVINDIANGILAASARAWIRAFVAQTGLIARTIRVKHTFRTATGIRITMELGQTITDTVVTLGIWTTR